MPFRSAEMHPYRGALRIAAGLSIVMFFDISSWAQSAASSTSATRQPLTSQPALTDAEGYTGFTRNSMRNNQRALLTAVTDHDTLLRYARDFAKRNNGGDANTLLILLARPYIGPGLSGILNSNAARADLGTRDLIIELQLARAELLTLLGDQTAATSVLDHLAIRHAADYQITFSRDGRKATLSDQIERLRLLNLTTKGGSPDGR